MPIQVTKWWWEKRYYTADSKDKIRCLLPHRLQIIQLRRHDCVTKHSDKLKGNNIPSDTYICTHISKHTLLASWIKIDQLDVTCFIISLLNAQHVLNISTSILRSLWLICWVISWVVLLWFDVCWCYGVVRLGWCGIRMQAEASFSLHTDTTYIVFIDKISCLFEYKLLWNLK